MLLANRGDLDGAIEQLRLAAQYEPDDAGIRLRLADSLEFVGEAERALLHYQASARLDPSSEAAYVGAAQALASLGRSGEERDWLEQALDKIPSSGLLAHVKSWLLAMARDAAEWQQRALAAAGESGGPAGPFSQAMLDHYLSGEPCQFPAGPLGDQRSSGSCNRFDVERWTARVSAVAR